MQPIDHAAAHRYFSASCYNSVWGLLDKPSRTPEDNEQMVALAHASVWHWSQRADCTAQNRSIGYWQLSRVYAVLGVADRAVHYGNLCLAQSGDLEPFYIGYAHEALARASALIGDADAMTRHLQRARGFAGAVKDAEEQKILLADLETLGSN